MKLSWVVVILAAFATTVVGAQPDAGVGPSARPTVGLVSNGNSFLEAALRSVQTVSVVVMSPADFERADLDKFVGFVFDSYRPLRTTEGKNRLFFNSTPADTIVNLDAGGKVMAVADQQIGAWDPKSAILSGITLDPLYVSKAISLRQSDGWTVLAKGEKSILMMVSHPASKAVTVLVGFDVTTSNWPLKPSFPAFVSRIVSHEWLQH